MPKKTTIYWINYIRMTRRTSMILENDYPLDSIQITIYFSLFANVTKRSARSPNSSVTERSVNSPDDPPPNDPFSLPHNPPDGRTAGISSMQRK